MNMGIRNWLMRSSWAAGMLAASALLVAGLLLLPLYSQLTGNVFVLTLFTRVVILALAAATIGTIYVLVNSKVGLGLMAVVAANPLTLAMLWAALDLIELVAMLSTASSRTTSESAPASAT